MREKFWENYSLGELNSKEWEALCDGCGQCCLVREVENNQVTVFNIACELLDIEKSRCSDYQNRLAKVPYCHQLTAEKIPEYDWLPESCSYRRIYRGESLPKWHPLLAGNRQRMRKKGITVCRTAVPVDQVPRRKRGQHIIKTKAI
ncbi:YcgN family cysteine cluster protein [Denitrificimonas caeni]|uniref:YcgN family cysteine cluster protein n=1 Tax=Denitrificimonas caeni TaxID=521720 RepID=A0AAE9VTJ0_9GAMM|nr:YcgN family cysteine cluster protein [Denitrificimonas caeni]NLJ13570.1 YcgN family cysteine cluster protein [Gammaproteobacteria bacterium]WBE26120.1 YcgN family cysteine cluster protein [Denitrificimonas caeni]